VPVCVCVRGRAWAHTRAYRDVRASVKVPCTGACIDVHPQGSHLTRGMSVFDDESHLGRAPKVELVTGIDVDGLMAEFRRALS
jgi:inosine-uridine nucleoside N-ribohydrolase